MPRKLETVRTCLVNAEAPEASSWKASFTISKHSDPRQSNQARVVVKVGITEFKGVSAGRFLDFSARGSPVCYSVRCHQAVCGIVYSSV